MEDLGKKKASILTNRRPKLSAYNLNKVVKIKFYQCWHTCHFCLCKIFIYECI